MYPCWRGGRREERLLGMFLFLLLLPGRWWRWRGPRRWCLHPRWDRVVRRLLRARLVVQSLHLSLAVGLHCWFASRVVDIPLDIIGKDVLRILEVVIVFERLRILDIVRL